MTTYKAFREAVEFGLRAGSWTADELWGNVRPTAKVLDLIERVGDAKYQRWLVRMDEEGRLGAKVK